MRGAAAQRSIWSAKASSSLRSVSSSRSSAVAQAQRVGVVFDVHRGRAQVDDAAADRALLGVGPHLGHQVVVDFGLDLLRALQVHVVLVGAQVGDLLRR